MTTTSLPLRPYVLTGGRTHTGSRLQMHTLVSTPRYDPRFAPGLTPEARAVYEYARAARSVAELATICGLPLGVTRVIIDDLVRAGRLRVHPDASEESPEVILLERIRDGLRRLR